MLVMGGRSLAVIGAMLVLLVACTSGASRLNQEIYTTLEGTTACTTLLDENGQIGCSSAESGTQGILYKISTPSELASFANAPEGSYVALLAQSIFADSANVLTLESLNHFKGALVYDDSFQDATSTYSPDDINPNFNHGLPFGYGGRATTSWNTPGGGFNRFYQNSTEGAGRVRHTQSYAYLSPNDFVTVSECYNKHNQIVDGKNPSYDLCSAEINAFMWGALNAKTCLRRSMCDPLGNLNIFGGPRPFKKGDNVVMVAAQLDSMAFFHDLSFGADADISGIVALIAAADLLGQSGNTASRSLANPIMFMLFHGESFGYIGSSRFGYDMMRAPSVFPNSDIALGHDNIRAYIELNQLLVPTGTALHAHAYSPSGSPNNNVADVVTALTDSSVALGAGITITDDVDTDLPPSSLRGILGEIVSDAIKVQIPAIVLSDHGPTAFNNRYYHSQYDNTANIGFVDEASPAVTQICNIASVIARAAWSLSIGVGASNLPPGMGNTTADCQLVATLLDCIGRNQSCDYYNTLIGAPETPNSPINRYVGVAPADAVTSDQGTAFIRNALAFALAVNKNTGASKTDCNYANDPSSFNALFVGDTTCLNTSVYSQLAISPAFDGHSIRPLGTAASNYDNGRSPRHSTWTESQWGSISIRIFLVPSPSSQLGLLLGGIFYALVIGLIVWYVAKRIDGIPAGSTPVRT